MADLFSIAAAEEAQGRRRQMLRTAFGPTIAAALADPAVIEVMVNPDGKLWIERASVGREDSGELIASTEAERIIRLVAAHVRREVTDKAPIVSAELPETGERFEGVMPPVSPAPCFAVRNICRRRPCASSAAAIEKRSAMGLVLLVRRKVAAVERAFGTARHHGGGKEIRLFQRCGLKHFRREPAALGNTSPHLRNENLKAFAAHEPGRFLIGLGYGRDYRQKVAHEQSQGFRGDGLLARLARRRLAELVEPARQPLLQSLVLLWVERGPERLLDQRRLGAVAVLGYRLEFTGERM